jgi:hypothetical protein
VQAVWLLTLRATIWQGQHPGILKGEQEALFAELSNLFAAFAKEHIDDR